MAGKCCGDHQMPDILADKRLVNAHLIDTKIGVDAQGKDVYAGDCLTTCDDLTALDDKLTKSIEDAAKNLNQGANLPEDATDCTKPVTICGVTNILKSATGNPVQTALVEAVLKKAQTDPVYRTALGGALLSKRAGNRIEVRPDGIGVWDEAPPNLANQYVDAVNGNDNNAGTKDAPLKTVAKALSNIKGGTGIGDYNILMKSGQTHILDSYVQPLGNADVTFITYDDPKYGLASDQHGCPGYIPWDASDFIPAVLKVRNYTSNGYTWTPYITANNIYFRGVSIDHTDAPVTGPGAAQFMGLTTGLFLVQGGNVTIGTGRALARPGTLWGQSTNFDLQGSAKLVDAVYGPTVTLDATNPSSGPQVTCANGPTYTVRNFNGRSAITPTNLGISNDPATKRLFNGMTSWDIFANTAPSGGSGTNTGGTGTNTGGSGTNTGGVTASSFSVTRYVEQSAFGTHSGTAIYTVRGPVGATFSHNLGGTGVATIGADGTVHLEKALSARMVLNPQFTTTFSKDGVVFYTYTETIDQLTSGA